MAVNVVGFLTPVISIVISVFAANSLNPVTVTHVPSTVHVAPVIFAEQIGRGLLFNNYGYELGIVNLITDPVDS